MISLTAPGAQTAQMMQSLQYSSGALAEPKTHSGDEQQAHPTPDTTCKRECTNITCVDTSKICCEEPFKRGRVNVHTHVQMISETTLGPDKKRAVDPTSLILM